MKDAVSKELIDSCLLVVKCPLMFDGQDTVTGTQGEFDLTGLIYDSCHMGISHAEYVGLDTTFVVLSDTSYVINLVPKIPESVMELANQEIRIFPNPTNKLLLIEVSTSNRYSMEITSLNGQLILNRELKESTHQLDLSSFQKGVYFITIRSKDFITTRKIIKL